MLVSLIEVKLAHFEQSLSYRQRYLGWAFSGSFRNQAYMGIFRAISTLGHFYITYLKFNDASRILVVFNTRVSVSVQKCEQHWTVWKQRVDEREWTRAQESWTFFQPKITTKTWLKNIIIWISKYCVRAWSMELLLVLHLWLSHCKSVEATYACQTYAGQSMMSGILAV